MPFHIIESETIYAGRVFSVRKDQVELPDGKRAQIDVIEHSGAVALVPVDAEGQIWFVRQYRHPTGETLLELPAGMVEAGEDPDVCARREVREETGMAAGSLRKIGQFYLAPGYSTELMHVYLATELTESPLDQDEDEFLSVEKVPFEQAIELARAGEIRDAKSIAALFLAAGHWPLTQGD